MISPHLRNFSLRIGERLRVRLGTWLDGPVGPHEHAMYQVSLAIEIFATLVPWRILTHGGLSNLIHPPTSNATI
ncbi:DOPA 4,5-dioxygenase family protein [Mesorhizobium sp. PL10]